MLMIPRACPPARSLLLCILVSFCITACAFEKPVPKPPINLPFALEQGNEIVEVIFSVSENHKYTFGLTFKAHSTNDAADMKKLAMLMGDPEVRNYKGKYDMGAPLLLRLQVESMDKQKSDLAFDQTTEKIFLYAGGFGDYKKKIADIHLKPGTYKAKVENIKASPLFNGREVYFHVHKNYLGK